MASVNLESFNPVAIRKQSKKHDLNIPNLGRFQLRLLRWFDANKRDLPWRRTHDPYRIWISEIMLQQTRVAAVVEYYQRFLRAFPTLRALALADEQDVLAQWSGLGYYRRARMLHAAAKELMLANKPFPRTSAELKMLPGIGRYTASAIASIAFDEPTAVVDGNVERVILRLAGMDENDAVDFWASAQAMIHKKRPGDFNQAMMELGATVCIPKNPECSGCPVRSWCGTQGEHVSSKQSPRRTAQLAYLLAVRGTKIALVQRGKNVRLMPGMWELPSISPTPATTAALELRHSITNTDYQVKVFTGKTRNGRGQIELSKVEMLPLTGLTRKILRRMGFLSHRNIEQFKQTR